MKRLEISCWLLFGFWMLTPSAARCQERLPPAEERLPAPPPKEDLPPPAMLPPPGAPPLAPPGCAACGRTLSVPRITLFEEQKAIAVPKLNLREVVVGSACGLDVEYRQSLQTVGEWALQPREVVQLVPCTTLMPVTVTDPCTGQCRTEYKACPIVREVKIVVMDKVLVPRTVAVSVPCLKPGPPLQVSKLVVDTTMEPAICSRFQVLTVPNVVPVPACPPCPIPHP